MKKGGEWFLSESNFGFSCVNTFSPSNENQQPFFYAFFHTLTLFLIISFVKVSSYPDRGALTPLKIERSRGEKLVRNNSPKSSTYIN